MTELKINVFENGRWYSTVLGTSNPTETIKQYKRQYDRVKVEYLNGSQKG